ncbi:hypothetical protein HBI16_162910 [Parastagonospora nodorum]|nr:hypothetical protein HBI16_162910 [Parastagonospora nodorum]
MSSYRAIIEWDSDVAAQQCEHFLGRANGRDVLDDDARHVVLAPHNISDGANLCTRDVVDSQPNVDSVV